MTDTTEELNCLDKTVRMQAKLKLLNFAYTSVAEFKLYSLTASKTE